MSKRPTLKELGLQKGKIVFEQDKIFKRADRLRSLTAKKKFSKKEFGPHIQTGTTEGVEGKDVFGLFGFMPSGKQSASGLNVAGFGLNVAGGSKLNIVKGRKTNT